MPIVTREEKGSALTHEEMDNNLKNLQIGNQFVVSKPYGSPITLEEIGLTDEMLPALIQVHSLVTMNGATSNSLAYVLVKKDSTLFTDNPNVIFNNGIGSFGAEFPSYHDGISLSIGGNPDITPIHSFKVIYHSTNSTL